MLRMLLFFAFLFSEVNGEAAVLFCAFIFAFYMRSLIDAVDRMNESLKNV